METRRSFDVIVVGGGPAGSTAALHLSKQGIDTALLEKSPIPRYKPCGGGIVRRVKNILDVDIGDTVERECYSAELSLIDANLSFYSERDFPIVSMTMRDSFDACLTVAAKKSGAIVFPDCRVSDVTVRSDRIDLTTSKGTFSSRYVIGADGAMSTVGRKGGWRETRSLIPAVEYEVRVPSSSMKRLGNSAKFHFGLLPYGYAWTFPKENHLSIGMGSMRRGTIDFRKKFKEYLKVLGIDEISGVDRYGSVIPVTPRKDGFYRNRIILTGDAAGFADPLLGEGITFAVMSGRIAASSIKESDFDESRMKESYVSGIRDAILCELEDARFLSRFLYDHPQLRNRAFASYGQKLSDAVTDIVSGERTYREIAGKLRDWLF